jgi:hypothetical protein
VSQDRSVSLENVGLQDRQRILCLPTVTRPAQGPILPRMQWIPVPVSLVAKRRDLKTDHFAEDSKNYARIIFLHHLKIDVVWLLARGILF